jgi:hypothetical protein
MAGIASVAAFAAARLDLPRPLLGLVVVESMLLLRLLLFLFFSPAAATVVEVPNST